MQEKEQLDGIIDLNFSIVDRNNTLLAEPRYCRVIESSDSQHFLLIEEAGLLLPITDDLDLVALENAVNAWIARPALVTRGGAYSVREVIKKLKKLGFREKSTEGSHAQFVSEECKGKVTVPVHGGEIPKGTLKSILNQAGINMATFAMV